MHARLVLPSGTEVRGFVLEQELGSGGFGTVYRARRGERRYALKFIRCEEAGGWAKREVESLLRVSHRNVVGFEGCGFWPDDTREHLVVIMDYVEGRRLDRWAQEENPDARQVAQKVLGVARALAEIHRAGVIHRDLKEPNILVRALDGEAVLVDFGVAGGTNLGQATREVLPPCTLKYRAPEAWRFLRDNALRPGSRYQPGPADDLYALGEALYWLLTGRHPCVGATEVEQAEVTIHQVPEPPRVINPRVPEARSALCMKLLEKQPEARYPDAGGLGVALEAELASADEGWSMPLCDAHAADNLTTEGALARAADDDGVDHWLREARHAHERPRRGRRPTFTERRAAHPTWSVAPRVAPWAAWMLGLVAVLGMAIATLPARLTPSLSTSDRVVAPSPTGFFTVIPELTQETTWKVGWKVAPPWKPPEAALSEQGETSVSNPRQKQKKVISAVGKAITTGAACVGVACTGPQVRPEPPSEPCPPGAVEAMAELRIPIGEKTEVVFVPGPVAEITSVREGWANVRLAGTWWGLPKNAVLKGRLIFGGERVYGRFTEAQEWEGSRTWPVCMELMTEVRGVELEPGSTAEEAKVFNAMRVKAVTRFQ